MGLRVSMLSGVSVLGVVTEWSKICGEGTADVWLVAIAISGAQYSGDELMKFRGDDVKVEVVEGWDATGRVEGLNTGPIPFEEGEESVTGFRGKLVS